MLTEINCEKFIENRIVFKSGLNSILGDNSSTNSIGKSTLLMIIDYVFGGNSFIENNSGAINKLGDLTFKFKFEFNSNTYFFKRATEASNVVLICDNKYNKLNEVSIDNYTELLKNNFSLNIDSSFRSAINPYSRIWKKDNYKVDKPIFNFSKEPESASIENLIKLFGMFSKISETSKQIKEQEESKKILTGMFKKNIIPKMTKKDYLKNESEIQRIKNEIKDIQDNLLKFTLNIKELSNKELLEIKTEKQKLIEAQSLIQNKIRRLEINLGETKVKSKYFNRLSQFFENPNEGKINEIESFHNKISAILKREIEAAKEILNRENEEFNLQLSILDEKINSLLSNVESPKFIVEKIYDLTVKANILEGSNKYFHQKETAIEEVKSLNTSLDTTINNILADIETRINSELIRINKEIHSDKKKIPSLSLKRSSYKFDHSLNTGTGKSFADLIEFDLAILKLTDLPILIHDSVLFKNIEDKSIDKIIEQYSTFEKQIFIALDGINKFSGKSQKTLNDTSVIKLSDSRKLFNDDWS